MAKTELLPPSSDQPAQASRWFPRETPVWNRPGIRVVSLGALGCSGSLWLLSQFFQLRGFVNIFASRLCLFGIVIFLAAPIWFWALNLRRGSILVGSTLTIFLITGTFFLDRATLPKVVPSSSLVGQVSTSTALPKIENFGTIGINAGESGIGDQLIGSPADLKVEGPLAVNPGQYFDFTIDSDFPNAEFIFLCDKPCQVVYATVDKSIYFTFQPFSTGNPKVAGVRIQTPTPLEYGTKVSGSIRSKNEDHIKVIRAEATNSAKQDGGQFKFPTQEGLEQTEPDASVSKTERQKRLSTQPIQPAAGPTNLSSQPIYKQDCAGSACAQGQGAQATYNQFGARVPPPNIVGLTQELVRPVVPDVGPTGVRRRFLPTDRSEGQFAGNPGLKLSFRVASPFDRPKFLVKCDHSCSGTRVQLSQGGVTMERYSMDSPSFFDLKDDLNSTLVVPLIQTLLMPNATVIITIRSRDNDPVTSAAVEGYVE